MKVFISVMIRSFIKSKSDTELFHILRPDHACPMEASGLVQLPHLAPGEGAGVKLEDCGIDIVSIPSSC